MKDVKVYAQNLRSYNMGLDQGRWLTLGIEEQELQRILTEQLHLTENHPDMAIFDYQADFEISEYEDIYELNLDMHCLKITVWLQKLKLLVWKVILITKRMEGMKPLIHTILVTMAL